MHAHLLRLGIAAALVTALSACATYRDDLERAKTHYNANKYPEALALLEVLEIDLDSLSPSERAEYAYYRGMSYYRLGHKRHARHWLGRAAARDKKYGGALGADSKKRVSDTLGTLNQEVWGGSATVETKATATCRTDMDCAKGTFCDTGSGTCQPASGGAREPAADTPPATPDTTAPPPELPPTKTPPKPEPEPPPAAAPSPDGKGKACKRALDCPGSLVCQDGVCSEP